MARKERFFIIGVILTLSVAAAGFSQENARFSGSITDSDNRVFTLSDITVSGKTVLHCRLQDALFKLSLADIRSVVFTTGGDSPYPGYMLADFVLASGGIASAYVNVANYRIEGIEENFNIRVTFVLSEIQRIEILRDNGQYAAEE